MEGDNGEVHGEGGPRQKPTLIPKHIVRVRVSKDKGIGSRQVLSRLST